MSSQCNIVEFLTDRFDGIFSAKALEEGLSAHVEGAVECDEAGEASAVRLNFTALAVAGGQNMAAEEEEMAKEEEKDKTKSDELSGEVHHEEVEGTASVAEGNGDPPNTAVLPSPSAQATGVAGDTAASWSLDGDGSMDGEGAVWSEAELLAPDDPVLAMVDLSAVGVAAASETAGSSETGDAVDARTEEEQYVERPRPQDRQEDTADNPLLALPTSVGDSAAATAKRIAAQAVPSSTPQQPSPLAGSSHEGVRDEEKEGEGPEEEEERENEGGPTPQRETIVAPAIAENSHNAEVGDNDCIPEGKAAALTTLADAGGDAEEATGEGQDGMVKDARDRARWMMEEFDRLASALASKEPAKNSKGNGARRRTTAPSIASDGAAPTAAAVSPLSPRRARSQEAMGTVAATSKGPRHGPPSMPATWHPGSAAAGEPTRPIEEPAAATALKTSAVPATATAAPAVPFEVVLSGAPVTQRLPPPPFDEAAMSRTGRKQSAGQCLDTTAHAIQFMKERLKGGGTGEPTGGVTAPSASKWHRRHASNPDLLDAVNVDDASEHASERASDGTGGGNSDRGGFMGRSHRRTRSLDGELVLDTAEGAPRAPRAGRPGARSQTALRASLVRRLPGTETTI